MGGFPRLQKESKEYGVGPLAPPDPVHISYAKELISDAIKYHGKGNRKLAAKVIDLAIESLQSYKEVVEASHHYPEKEKEETEKEACKHAFKYTPGADAKICSLCGKLKPLSHG